MDIEESVRRIVEGDFDETVKKIRHELQQKDKVIAESQQVIAESKQALAEKDKHIAELLAQLNSTKR
jgi:paraquat-inducible protein B